jgi:concanavalin A-like lectin/glucanase superfamily protein
MKTSMKTTQALFLVLTLTTALAIQLGAQTYLTNGLVAYYPFNGNANDASGNGHNGTNINAILAPDRFGVSNACYSFNGTNSHIDIGSSIALGKPHDAMTISVWFLARTNYNPQFGPVLQIITDFSGPDGYSPTGDDYYFASLWFSSLQDGTNQLFFDNRSYPLSFLNDSMTVVDDNRWHSCAVVLDGQGTNLLYVDGVLSAQDSSIATLSGVVASPYVGYYDSTLNYLNNQFWRIGASQWSGQIWNVFNGLIDDVRIYNVALSSNQVQQLYQYESLPQIALLEAVVPSFSNLYVGTNYQLQISTNLSGTFTNYGSTFAATNSTMTYPQYFNVANWSQLFFRLVAP